MKKLGTSFLLFGIVIWTFAFEAIDGNEGQKCETSDLPGVCTEIGKCQIALAAVKKGKPHNLTRCGFNGFEEIVCCPNINSRNPTSEVTIPTDKNIIWDNNNNNKNNEVDKSNEEVTPEQRINKKTKSEKACEKIVKDHKLNPLIQFNIIDGEDAKIGEFPHMAAMGFLNPLNESSGELNWQLCAASLISSQFLITAAHCFVNQFAPQLKMVRLGVVKINSTSPKPQDYAVEDTMVHNKYNTRSRHNDIALIKVKRSVKMTKNVRPACLYSENDDPTGLLVTGWGDIERGTGYTAASTLQVASLSPVSVDQCNSSLLGKSAQILSERTIVNSQICAMSPRRSDSCQAYVLPKQY